MENAMNEHGEPALDTTLVTKSFQRLAPKADWVSKYFYAHLFTNHPEVRSMFPKDMDMQRDRLVASLVRIVGHIDNAPALENYLSRLGHDHQVDLGVRPEHYPAVGESLIATLRYMSGSMWSAELEAQWILAYGIIADIMIRAGEAAANAVEPTCEERALAEAEDAATAAGVAAQMAAQAAVQAADAARAAAEIAAQAAAELAQAQSTLALSVSPPPRFHVVEDIDDEIDRLDEVVNL